MKRALSGAPVSRASSSRGAQRRVAAALVAAALVACTTTTTSVTSNEGTADSVAQKRDGPAEQRRRAAIRLQLAVNYYQDGKFSIALDELKEALRLDPDYADAHNVQALVYTELHENVKAEQEFRRALEIEPANSDLNNNYGWYLCQNGREKESLAFFENALKNPLYRQPAKPLQNAGVCSLKVGNRDQAEDYFRRSFELDPTGTVSAYNLAEIYYERKDLARARFYVNQVNSSPVPTPASLWLGIRIERRLGNKSNETALGSQLERLYADSREAQLQKRGMYGD